MNSGTSISLPYSCDSCDAYYTAKTKTSPKAQVLEHRKSSFTTSEVSRHINIENPENHVDMDEVKVLTVEPRWFERGVREAIHIRMEQPFVIFIQS